MDISAPALEAARRMNIHDEYILADFMTFDTGRRFDVVVLSHVIEHFERDVALEVLRKVESMANNVIYIETANGFLEQLDFDGNVFQRHLSGWFPHDFQARGYTVFGAGPKWLRGPMGKSKMLPEFAARTVSRLTQWYFFRRPQAASTISAIKYVDGRGNVRSL
jgi:hypothetical protein